MFCHILIEQICVTLSKYYIFNLALTFLNKCNQVFDRITVKNIHSVDVIIIFCRMVDKTQPTNQNRLSSLTLSPTQSDWLKSPSEDEFGRQNLSKKASKWAESFLLEATGRWMVTRPQLKASVTPSNLLTLIPMLVRSLPANMSKCKIMLLYNGKYHCTADIPFYR